MWAAPVVAKGIDVRLILSARSVRSDGPGRARRARKPALLFFADSQAKFFFPAISQDLHFHSIAGVLSFGRSHQILGFADPPAVKSQNDILIPKAGIVRGAAIDDPVNHNAVPGVDIQVIAQLFVQILHINAYPAVLVVALKSTRVLATAGR